MATTNLGRVAIIPKGNYDSTVNYKPLDLVRYENGTYLVLAAVSGEPPSAINEKYMLIAQDGAKGDPGEAPTFVVESTTTLPAGSNAHVVILDVGTGEVKLSFGIPKGADGNAIYYGICSTAATTVAKTVTLKGFTLQSGAAVAVKFTYSNTAASPTLNINSTGASPIYSCFTNSAIVSGNIAAGMTAFFIYNGTQWMLMNPVQTVKT